MGQSKKPKDNSNPACISKILSHWISNNITSILSFFRNVVSSIEMIRMIKKKLSMSSSRSPGLTSLLSVFGNVVSKSNQINSLKNAQDDPKTKSHFFTFSESFGVRSNKEGPQETVSLQKFHLILIILNGLTQQCISERKIT